MLGSVTSASLPSMASKPRPGSLRPIRLLPASAPSTTRNVERHRALFGLDPKRPQLVAAWWRGDTLTAAAAADLWRRHQWQPVLDPPPDVAEMLEQGKQLAACDEAPAERNQLRLRSRKSQGRSTP